MRVAGGLILALGLAGLAGCAAIPPPDPGDALVATLGQSGGDVVLRPEQQLLVRLYLEEGTGVIWRVSKADHLYQMTKVGAMAGRMGRPLPPSVGHGGVVQTFSFKAVGRGEGELTFVLRASHDEYAPPKEIATYRVRVL
jgi:hypothetical protein